MFKHFFLAFLLVLAGCESPPEGVHVIVLSNISPIYESSLEQALMEKTNQQFDIHVQLYPLSREKFSVLLSERAGDVYITDKTHLSGLLTKNGLTPLEELFETEYQDSFKPFMTKNEKTGEVHLYGMPLEKDISLFKEAEIKEAQPLVAILPFFSPYKEEGKKIIEAFVGERGERESR
jgi:hypothetical protein